jgi:tripartite-type tricarboxylate transporter receptor subunit TctC
MQKLCIFVLALFFSSQIYAENYQVFVGVGPGGPADVMVRKLTAEAEKKSNDKFIVVNKPGAEFMVAYQEFIREGQRNKNVMFVNNAGFYINTALPANASLNLRPFTDAKSLITLISFDILFLSKKDSPIKNMNNVKGKLSLGYVGSTTKLLADKLNLDPDIALIPYKTDNAGVMAVLSNEVDLATAVDFSTTYLAYKDSFQVVGNSKKLLNTSSAMGLSVPQSMPDSQVAELNRLFNQVFNDPEFSSWFVSTYHKKPHGGSPQEFDRIINDYYKKIAK